MLLGRLISKSTNQEVLNPIPETTYSGVFISVSGSLSKLTMACLYLVLYAFAYLSARRQPL